LDRHLRRTDGVYALAVTLGHDEGKHEPRRLPHAQVGQHDGCGATGRQRLGGFGGLDESQQLPRGAG